MVGGRGKGEPDTGTNHLGFRCVLPVPAAEESRKVVALGSDGEVKQRDSYAAYISQTIP